MADCRDLLDHLAKALVLEERLALSIHGVSLALEEKGWVTHVCCYRFYLGVTEDPSLTQFHTDRLLQTPDGIWTVKSYRHWDEIRHCETQKFLQDFLSQHNRIPDWRYWSLDHPCYFPLSFDRAIQESYWDTMDFLAELDVQELEQSTVCCSSSEIPKRL